MLIYPLPLAMADSKQSMKIMYNMHVILSRLTIYCGNK